MPTPETFDLQATVNMVVQAFGAIVCTIGFQLATVGLGVACVIGALAVFALSRRQRHGKPLLVVFRKIGIFCAILALPGAACLLTQGRLPQVNQLVLNPLGLLGFWGLVIAHFCMEEMNFQFFPDK